MVAIKALIRRSRRCFRFVWSLYLVIWGFWHFCSLNTMICRSPTYSRKKIQLTGRDHLIEFYLSLSPFCDLSSLSLTNTIKQILRVKLNKGPFYFGSLDFIFLFCFWDDMFACIFESGLPVTIGRTLPLAVQLT